MSGIFSLVSIATDGDNCKYLHAISYDRTVLERMLADMTKSFASEEGVSVAFAIEADSPLMELTKKVVLQPKPGTVVVTGPGHIVMAPGIKADSILQNVRTELVAKLKTNFSNIQLPLFCMQIEVRGQIVDYLLDLNGYSYESATMLLGDAISSNPILFDTLYEEGAMNA